MPTKTSGNLQLNKPANGEYQDNWDVPVNENADTIDTHVSAVEDEIEAARGSSSSLSERLNAGLEPDGSPMPVPEVIKSRYSQIAGRYDDLYSRLNTQDQEVLPLRGGKTSLIEGLSYFLKDSRLNLPISGPVGGSNAANFLTTSGSVFTIDGDPTPVLMNCGGYIQVCRIDKSTDLVGQLAGTKYIYAQRNTSGRTIESGADGSTGGTLLNEFTSVGAQFQTKKVQAGDVLELSAGPNADKYIVESITNETTLVIKGQFVDARGGQSYIVKDMLHPTISYEATKAQDGTKCYLGELYFNGTVITSSVTYAYRSEFESDWIAIDVSSSPVFTQTFNHNLGVLPKSIMIYVSQSDDESTPAELLSVADVASDYALNFNAGTGDSSVSPTGGPYMNRSVKAQFTRTIVTMQNVRSNVFYKDYTGTTRTTGYLKLIARG